MTFRLIPIIEFTQRFKALFRATTLERFDDARHPPPVIVGSTRTLHEDDEILWVSVLQGNHNDTALLLFDFIQVTTETVLQGLSILGYASLFGLSY